MVIVARVIAFQIPISAGSQDALNYLLHMNEQVNTQRLLSTITMEGKVVHLLPSKAYLCFHEEVRTGTLNLFPGPHKYSLVPFFLDAEPINKASQQLKTSPSHNPAANEADESKLPLPYVCHHKRTGQHHPQGDIISRRQQSSMNINHHITVTKEKANE